MIPYFLVVMLAFVLVVVQVPSLEAVRNKNSKNKRNFVYEFVDHP